MQSPNSSFLSPNNRRALETATTGASLGTRCFTELKAYVERAVHTLLDKWMRAAFL